MFGIGKYKICFRKIDDYFNNNILKCLIRILFLLILAKSWTALAQQYSNTGSAEYLTAAAQQKRAIYPMLVQRLRRWPDIETALGDCPVFAENAHYYDGDAFTSRRQKSHYPDNTIYWPDADVMVGHLLWCWANIIPTLSL